MLSLPGFGSFELSMMFMLHLQGGRSWLPRVSLLFSLVAVISGCAQNRSSLQSGFKLDSAERTHQNQEKRVPKEIKKISEARNSTVRSAASRLPLRRPKGPDVRVGVLLPLTGPHALLGKSIFSSIELALFTVGTKNLVLLPRDTQGTPEGARIAARSAIDSGAEFLIGPVFSGSARAVAAEKRGTGIISIALTNDYQSSDVDSYVMGLLPGQRLSRIVSFAFSRGLRRFAYLLPEGAYGDVIAQAFQTAVVEAGGTIVRTVRYSKDNQLSLSRAVKRLANYDRRRSLWAEQKKILARNPDPISKKALRRLENREALGRVGFDAVLLIEDGPAITALAPLLPYYEIDIRRVRILGISDWGERSILREPAMNGAWYTSLSPSAVAKFVRNFKGIFGYSPNSLAPLAYDAGAIAAFLSAQNPPAFSNQMLTNSRGFSGSVGLFRFRKNGTVQHNFSVLEVTPKGAKEISPPPREFPMPAIN
jgi:branched-chain amino acid transport system substrate-binding protein